MPPNSLGRWRVYCMSSLTGSYIYHIKLLTIHLSFQNTLQLTPPSVERDSVLYSCLVSTLFPPWPFLFCFQNTKHFFILNKNLLPFHSVSLLLFLLNFSPFFHWLVPSKPWQCALWLFCQPKLFSYRSRTIFHQIKGPFLSSFSSLQDLRMLNSPFSGNSLSQVVFLFSNYTSSFSNVNPCLSLWLPKLNAFLFYFYKVSNCFCVKVIMFL